MSKIQIAILIIIVTAVTSIFFLLPTDQKDQTEYYPEEDQMSLVTISTSAGDIHLELDADNAPITVANFLKLAEDGYYEAETPGLWKHVWRPIQFVLVVDDFFVEYVDK